MGNNASELKEYVVMFEYEIGYDRVGRAFIIKAKDPNNAYNIFLSEYAYICFDPCRYKSGAVRMFSKSGPDSVVFDEISPLSLVLAQ